MKLPFCALLLTAIALGAPMHSLLAADGAIDPTYQPSNIYGGVIATQSDGKVLINVYSGTTKKLVRFNADGTPDDAFPPAAIAGVIGAVRVQADDKILVTGITSIGGAPAGPFVRLNADGTLDSSFNPPTGGPSVYRVEVLYDNRLLVSLGDRAGLQQLQADGTPDPSFKVDPSVTLTAYPPFVVLPTGKIVVAYPAADGSSRLARLNADGSVDASFQFPADGLANSAGLPQIGFDSALNIIVFGSTVIGDNLDPANYTPFLRRFTFDGAFDPTFTPPTITGVASNGSNERPGIRAVAAAPDGKIFVGGVFTALNGTSEPGLARLNADGSVDPDFVAGGGKFTGGGIPSQVNALLLDNGLLVTGVLGGIATDGEESSDIGTARLLAGSATLPPPPPPIAIPQPDFSGKVSDFKAAFSANGSKLKIRGKLKVYNNGPGSAKNVPVAAFVSNDQTFDAADLEVMTVSLKDAGFKKLKPYSATGHIPFKFKVPAAQARQLSGKYVLVVIDPDNKMDEIDETNNVVVLGPLP